MEVNEVNRVYCDEKNCILGSGFDRARAALLRALNRLKVAKFAKVK